MVKDYNFTPIVMSKEFEVLEQTLMVEIIRRRQQPPAKPPVNTNHDNDEDIAGIIKRRTQFLGQIGGWVEVSGSSR